MLLKEKILYLCSSVLHKLKTGKRTADPENVKRILIFKMDDIGDMVYTLHVFNLLHKKYPESKLELLCKPVNEIFFKYLPHVTLHNSFETIEKVKYDLVFDLRGNFKTLMFSLKNAKAYFDRGTIRWRNKRSGGQKQEVHTNYEIIEPAIEGIPFAYPQIKIGAEERKKVHQWLENQEITQYMIIHAGANSEARRWPKARFAEMTKSVLKQNKMAVIFVGGPHEKDEIEFIQRLIPSKTYSVAGDFSLLDLAALCEGADVFVGNESGPLHVATAMNCPVVALFGPGVVNVFYPYHENARIIHHQTDIRDENTGENTSMQLIQVEEVLKHIESLTV